MAEYTHWSSGRTRYTIGEIIERDVTMEGYDERDQIRALRKKHERLLAIVKVIADVVLTDEQEATVARSLHYEAVSGEIGRRDK